jgi:hypothetical protein
MALVIAVIQLPRPWTGGVQCECFQVSQCSYRISRVLSVLIVMALSLSLSAIFDALSLPLTLMRLTEDEGGRGSRETDDHPGRSSHSSGIHDMEDTCAIVGVCTSIPATNPRSGRPDTARPVRRQSSLCDPPTRRRGDAVTR